MKAAASAWEKLLRQPARFGFDAALRVLLQRAGSGDPGAAVRFRSHPGLGHAPGEVGAVEAAPGRPPLVTVSLIGLIGPAGTLPRLYGTMAARMQRGRSTALHDFLDTLAHRMVAFFGGAGRKYRLARSTETAGLAGTAEAEPVRRALLALTGHLTAGSTARLAVGVEPLLHHAGLFAARPRSAERLAALVGDWLGEAVEVDQFAGAWLALPEAERTALPRGRVAGGWNRLGADAAIGVRTWDAQARIVLRIGPLDRATFDSLLPGRPGHIRLASLVAAFLEGEVGFALNPVLRGPDVPRLRLGGAAALGWNTWLEPPSRAAPRADAAEAVFAAGTG